MDEITMMEGASDLLTLTVRDLLPDRKIEALPSCNTPCVLIISDRFSDSIGIGLEEVKICGNDPNRFLILVKSRLQKLYRHIAEQAIEQLNKLETDTNILKLKT